MKDLIIAIDGFSSAGKSTLAKQLAKKLNYAHIDSGAMYRAVSLFAFENNLIQDDKVNIGELVNRLKDVKIYFELNSKGESEIFLNEKCIENEIRNIRISSGASLVAKIKEVREFLVDLQRELGKEKRIVMDGRDIGTVVFPDADVKIFLNASVKERAKRRYEELMQKGEKVNFEEVKKSIEERDLADTMREISPLRRADDAIDLDNGKLTPKETLSQALEITRAKTK